MRVSSREGQAVYEHIFRFPMRRMFQMVSSNMGTIVLDERFQHFSCGFEMTKGAMT